jgi:hypothetical protein
VNSVGYLNQEAADALAYPVKSQGVLIQLD